MYKPPFKITSEILNLTAGISEEIARLEILESHRQIPLKTRKSNRIKTIAGTLQIEGNTLDEKAITAILNGKRVLAKHLEIAEVKGAIELYNKIDDFDYKKLDDLLAAHKILMGEILTAPGIFRNKNVGVGKESEVIHVAPPHKHINSLIADLFEWLQNNDEHPLIVSSVFHYEFEFIHPFIDGNGRIGRFWQTLILYNWKKIFGYLPVESIIRDNQKEYYLALKEAGSSGESTPFIKYMLEIILLTCKNLSNVPENDLKNVPEKRIKKLINQIKNNDTITINELANSLNVSPKTIKRDLEKLKRDGIIIREGSNRSGKWVVL